MDEGLNKDKPEHDPGAVKPAKLSMAKDSLGISGANLISLAASVPLGFLNAYILGPALLGVFKLASLILDYARFSDLGLLNALSRQYPIALAQDDQKACREIVDVCCSATLVMALVYMAGFIALYLAGWDYDGQLDLLLVVIIAAWILAQRLLNQVHFFFLAVGSFGRYANTYIILALSTLVLSIPLLLLYGLPGVLAGVALANLATAMWLFNSSSFSFRLRLHYERLHSLWKVSRFLFFCDFITLMRSRLDLTMVAFMGDPTALGLYGFAHGAIAVVENAPKGVMMVVRRNILLIRGERGVEDRDYFADFLGNQFSAFLLVSLLGVSAVVFFYNFIVVSFLPKMLPSLAVLSILVWGFLFRQQHGFVHLLMDLSDHLPQLSSFHAAFVALQAGLTWLFMARWGMMGAAYAFVCIEMVYCLFTYLYFYPRIGMQRAQAFKRYAALGLGHVVMAAAIGGLALAGAPYIADQATWYGKIGVGCMVMAVQMVLMTGLGLLIYGLLFMKHNFISEVWRLGRALGSQLKAGLRNQGD